MKTIAAACAWASFCLLFAGGARGEEVFKLSQSLSNPPAAVPAAAVPAAAVPAPSVPATIAPANSIPAVSASTAGAPAPRSSAPIDSARAYRIGEDDLIEFKVFGVDQLSTTVRVDPRGLISLPLIGPIKVAGMTAHEAEILVAAKLRENYLQNPQVSLFIKEYTAQRVTVEGAVNRPGVYPLRGHSTLLTSLAMAGGPARMSELSQVMLFRDDGTGKRVATMHDVDRIRTGEAPDPVVFNDDLIVVNRTGSRVALRDSLFGDLLDVINPFHWVPAP